MRAGKSYPEGGSGERKVIDLCLDCSNSLISLLIGMGYNIRNEDGDW